MPSDEAQKGITLYRAWHSLKQRCKGHGTKDCKKSYLSRGITYDPVWEKFENFYADMEASYVKGLSLDRINNDGNYCKENCRWADKKTQAINRSNTKMYSFNGESKTLSDWAPIVGIKRSTLSMRIFVSGWSIEKTLTTPVR